MQRESEILLIVKGIQKKPHKAVKVHSWLFVSVWDVQGINEARCVEYYWLH